ncbi:hypothetical protein ECAI27_46750 [Escherichia coli AI27]|nr:hypothetical protein ECAI27_46750 [Escherichia coli AI27]
MSVSAVTRPFEARLTDDTAVPPDGNAPISDAVGLFLEL